MDITKEIKGIFGAPEPEQEDWSSVAPKDLDEKINSMIKEMQTGWMTQEERDAIKDKIEAARSVQHRRAADDDNDKKYEERVNKKESVSPKQRFKKLRNKDLEKSKTKMKREAIHEQQQKTYENTHIQFQEWKKLTSEITKLEIMN